MNHTASSRRTRSAVVAALVVLSAVIGVAGSRLIVRDDLGFVADPRPSVIDIGQQGTGPPSLGVAGRVRDGATVFDDAPALTNLDPALLRAVRQAATDAADDEVVFYVNSGWRSAEYQEQLLRDAISRYGSQEEASRWVATPETSVHVSGEAVDIGPSDAVEWLSEHGSKYGLCQIYDNEPWHVELRPDAIDEGCPPRYADPTHDPRMQQ